MVGQNLRNNDQPKILQRTFLHKTNFEGKFLCQKTLKKYFAPKCFFLQELNIFARFCSAKSARP